MAAPNYTTDLTTYNDCTSATGWVELVGMALSAPPDVDTDLAIHGSICITSDRAKVGLSSNAFVGAGITLATGEGIFVWHKFFAPNSLATLANGGVRVMIGDSGTVYDGWYLDGSDTYPYGGWVNHVVDPTTTPDQTAGTTTGTYAMVGNGWNLPTQAPAKGNPFGTDIIRYGRGESRFTDGDVANGYATFDGYALVNDHPTTGRFGLIQDQGGSYLYKGLMSLGLTATSVDMRDSNVVLNIENTTKVLSSFNRIEIHNSSSNVEWTSVLITALGTVSRGEFEMIDNATISFTNCVFTEMSTFIFQSNATSITTTYRSTGQITQGSSTFTGCIFDANREAVTILSDNPAVISGCKFTSDGSNHALEITTPGTYSFTGNTFSDYAATDGSTGNECIYNNSGGLVTINISGGDTPTYRDGTSATTVINNTVAVTFTGLIDNTEVRVYAAGTETELAGIEVATVGTTDDRSFTFSLSAGISVDYRIHNIQYDIIQIYSYSIPSTATSLPIQQQYDRWYLNP